MGRTNRSRKRQDKMNKIKKARYDAKELIRLKKTLGILDDEVMKDVSEVAEVKTGKDLKKQRKSKEQRTMEMELEDEHAKGKRMSIVNDNTGKVHVYNTKTLKDQHGSYPPWFRPKKTAKRIRKKNHAIKKHFKQGRTTRNVPLD